MTATGTTSRFSRIGGKARALLAAALIQAGAIGGAAASADFLPAGSLTSQPIGHYEFCQTLPAECRQKTAVQPPVELTRALWADVVEVNNLVNIMVEPKTDMEIWGVEERWSYPDGVGDCEDYVLEKRRRLMAIGVPAGNLLITVVRQRNGEGHAVLTLRTSLGDFILDNLEPRVLGWRDADHTFLKRQSDTHSGQWVSIEYGRDIAVGSLR